MDTSLASQLKRLAVPQTTILNDRKRFPSILYDPKEAAEIDRTTLYEVGLAGIQDLINFNDAFEEYRTTLFDESSKDVERSVETSEINDKLNENIRKFFCHLSPYFLLKPAHQCLEWLIRRFRINEFNKNDFMVLLLPYHNTQVAVRCIQTMHLKDPKDFWYWVSPVKKRGLPLSLENILSHSANNYKLLEMFGNALCEAVSMLGKQASNLQAFMNFYCQLAVGTLDIIKISDKYIKTVVVTVIKGLQQTVVDFKDMSLIIASYLMTRHQLNPKMIENILLTALNENIHVRYQFKVTVLLNLAYQYQEKLSITSELLLKLCTNTWIFESLNNLNQQNIDITNFLIPMIEAFFEEIYTNSEYSNSCMVACETLVDALKLDGVACEKFIKSMLKCYSMHKFNKNKKLSKKELDQVQKWHNELLTSIKSCCPTEFDKVVKIALNRRTDNKYLSLAFDDMLKHSFAKDELSLFEHLLSVEPELRKRAMHELRDQFKTLKNTINGNELIRFAITSRLDDENTDVVEATLSLGTEKLLTSMSAETLLQKLTMILVRGLEDFKLLKNSIKLAIEILINDSKNFDNNIYIMLLLYPYANIFKSNSKESVKIIQFMNNTEQDPVKLLETMTKFVSYEGYGRSNIDFLLSSIPNFKPSNGILLLKLIKNLIEQVKKNEQVNLYMDILQKCIKSKIMAENDLKIYMYKELIETLTKTEDKNVIYITLNMFLNKLSKDDEKKLEYLSQFCLIGQHSSSVSLLTLKLMHSIIKTGKIEVSGVTFVRLIFALMSPDVIVRTSCFAIFKCIKTNNNKNNHGSFVEELIKAKETIILDHVQFPLIMYTIFTDPKSGQLTQKQNLRKTFNFLLDYCLFSSTLLHEKVLIIHMFKHLSIVEVFDKLIPMGLDIIKDDDIKSINVENSIIMKYLIRFLGKKLAPHINKKGNIQTFFLKTLKSVHLIKTSESDNIIPVAAATLEMITPDVYGILDENIKLALLESIISSASKIESLSFLSIIHKFFKPLKISSKICIRLLDLEIAATSKIQKDKFNVKSTISAHFIKSEWQNVTTFLELLHNKLQVDVSFDLVPMFFKILKRIIELGDQPSTDYVKQLLLSSILAACQGLVVQGGSSAKKQYDKILKVELVIQCIRGTQNPQTHHHALLLLAHLAILCPDRVLHEVVAIFTFIGTSVARYDDNYSFFIMSQIIEKILPKIVEKCNESKQIIAILRVFSDIVLDVPAHRRLPIYTKMIEALGVSEHLWTFISVSLQSHVMHRAKEKQNRKREHIQTVEVSPRIEIALSIARNFSSEDTLETCSKLIQHISNVSENEEEQNTWQLMTDDYKFSEKDTRFYRYVSLQFIKSLLSGPIEIKNIEVLQPICSNLIADILRSIPHLMKAAAGDQRTTYWRVILNHYYDILESAIGVLSPDLFLKTIHELIQNHKNYKVRMRVTEMLNDKLKNHLDYFDDCNVANIIALLTPLKKVLDTVGCETTLPKGCTVFDIWSMQQLALTSIKLLARSYALSHKENFIVVLNCLVEKLPSLSAMCDKVAGGFLLCIAEVCANLKVYSIKSLHLIIPTLVSSIKATKAKADGAIVISALTALHKISNSLPNFLNPYLADIISISANLYADSFPAYAKQDFDVAIQSKLKTIFNVLSKAIPSRSIIPAIKKSYEAAINEQNFEDVGPIIELSQLCLEQTSPQDLQSLQPILASMFVDAIKLRCANELNSKKDVQSLEMIENYIVTAFCSLVIRLSENEFRPIYLKIHDWAFNEDALNRKQRTLTYFKLTSTLAVTLKSLFVLFADDTISPAADILKLTNKSKVCDLYFNNTKENLQITEYIFKTIHSIAVYDNQKFLNENRFKLIMEPIVDHVENTALKDSFEMKNLLKETITSLALSTSDVMLWKQLNMHLLSKTRHDEADIKMFAMEINVNLAQKLGDNFVQLLPESIPFYAELMESGISEVEQNVNKGLQQLKEAVGEDLQKYF